MSDTLSDERLVELRSNCNIVRNICGSRDPELSVALPIKDTESLLDAENAELKRRVESILRNVEECNRDRQTAEANYKSAIMQRDLATMEVEKAAREKLNRLERRPGLIDTVTFLGGMQDGEGIGDTVRRVVTDLRSRLAAAEQRYKNAEDRLDAHEKLWCKAVDDYHAGLTQQIVKPGNTEMPTCRSGLPSPEATPPVKRGGSFVDTLKRTGQQPTEATPPAPLTHAPCGCELNDDGVVGRHQIKCQRDRRKDAKPVDGRTASSPPSEDDLDEDSFREFFQWWADSPFAGRKQHEAAKSAWKRQQSIIDAKDAEIARLRERIDRQR